MGKLTSRCSRSGTPCCGRHASSFHFELFTAMKSSACGQLATISVIPPSRPSRSIGACERRILSCNVVFYLLLEIL
jgi:hypothetical protein